MELSEASDASNQDWSSEYAFDDDIDEEPTDIVDYLEDDVVPSRKKTLWSVITPDNIEQHQNEMMDYISEVMACPENMARRLLIEYNWDKTRLINEFVEKGKEFVFHRAGCSLNTQLEPPLESNMTCECCLCPMKSECGTTMRCKHWFCNDCWIHHFEVQIREGNSCRLKCMAFQCSCMCDEEKVIQLLSSRHKIKERYLTSLLESYVNDNVNVKWCPSVPNCGNAIRLNRDESCEPICDCGLHFCFACLEESHSPCTCEMWTAWEKKRVDDSETLNWITANTKPCPKCGKSVEKNGGCNLMTCRCGQHFCWLCGAATGHDHTYHTIVNHECGRWKQDLDKNIDNAASHHKRYMHYFSRWNGHRESLKMETSKEERMKEDLKDICGSLNGHEYDYNSVMAAVTVLISARKVVSNSYIFAFFMCGNNWYEDEVHSGQISLNRPLFEDMQQQFESSVEHLSNLLSTSDLNTDMERRIFIADVLNCARMVLKRMDNFYDAINSGLLGQLEQSVVSIADFRPQNLPL